MQASGSRLRTGYDAGRSPWSEAARDALESGELTEPFSRGDHETAARTLADLLICLTGSSFEASRLDCLELLALVEACRGRLSHAQELADAAENLALEATIPAAQRRAAGHLARAWVATERQELSRALHWLDRASRLEELRHDPSLFSLSVLLRARLMRDRGNPSAARTLLTSTVVPDAWVALEFEAEAAQLDSRTRWESSHVQRLLQQAERHCLRGRVDVARALTLQSLALAEPEQLRRPFAHAGPHVRDLVRSDGEVAAHAEWLSPAGHPNVKVVATPFPSPLPEDLTEREREVLRHLAALLSTQEIAAAMFISVNTVRTHVRHILDKLAATRRNEAVRRARALGLV